MTVPSVVLNGCSPSREEAVGPERTRNGDGEETPLPATFNL